MYAACKQVLYVQVVSLTHLPLILSSLVDIFLLFKMSCFYISIFLIDWNHTRSSISSFFLFPPLFEFWSLDIIITILPLLHRLTYQSIAIFCHNLLLCSNNLLLIIFSILRIKLIIIRPSPPPSTLSWCYVNRHHATAPASRFDEQIENRESRYANLNWRGRQCR